MKTTISVQLGRNRLAVKAGSRFAAGLAAAAVTHGWLWGSNLPRTAKGAERAVWAAIRSGRR